MAGIGQTLFEKLIAMEMQKQEQHRQQQAQRSQQDAAQAQMFQQMLQQKEDIRDKEFNRNLEMAKLESTIGAKLGHGKDYYKDPYIQRMADAARGGVQAESQDKALELGNKAAEDAEKERRWREEFEWDQAKFKAMNQREKDKIQVDRDRLTSGGSLNDDPSMKLLNDRIDRLSKSSNAIMASSAGRDKGREYQELIGAAERVQNQVVNGKITPQQGLLAYEQFKRQFEKNTGLKVDELISTSSGGSVVGGGGSAPTLQFSLDDPQFRGR